MNTGLTTPTTPSSPQLLRPERFWEKIAGANAVWDSDSLQLDTIFYYIESTPREANCDIKTALST